MQFKAVSRDVSAQWRTEVFQAGQHQVLEMIATGAPLAQVLTLLAHVIEDQYEGLLCQALLLEADGTHVRLGAAPSLPEREHLTRQAARLKAQLRSRAAGG